jgi:hypothetical protein
LFTLFLQEKRLSAVIRNGFFAGGQPMTTQDTMDTVYSCAGIIRMKKNLGFAMLVTPELTINP